ncbi:hypothetical protein GIB67_002215 [Kingdonia uniflora]|uniref:Uncharacterized protein n=1 Tax=Kingdonia uniflora TaxID=39325 RepID=A0A7J7KX25_9MAGN|nr:hypothetical protein GIB67_002215 [Kingdonia uniflora]
MKTKKKSKEMGHESTSKDLLEFEHKPDFMSSSLESKGVKVLCDDDEAFEEEEMKVGSEDKSNDLIDSDLEVLGEDVVEPDNDPLQKMGDPFVEVMNESRDESQMAKSLAMEALAEISVYIKMKKPNAAIRDAIQL